MDISDIEFDEMSFLSGLAPYHFTQEIWNQSVIVHLYFDDEKQKDYDSISMLIPEINEMIDFINQNRKTIEDFLIKSKIMDQFPQKPVIINNSRNSFPIVYSQITEELFRSSLSIFDLQIDFDEALQLYNSTLTLECIPDLFIHNPFCEHSIDGDNFNHIEICINNNQKLTLWDTPEESAKRKKAGGGAE